MAEYQGEMVGCVQALAGYPLGHMGFLAVSPVYQNQGIGVYLWKVAEQLLRSHDCYGFTAMSATPAILKHVDKVGAAIHGIPVKVIFKTIAK